MSGQPQTSVLTAYYMGGAYEVTGSAVKKHYSVAGMMVAVHDGTVLQYLLTDHLGSTVAVTNASGTLTSQQRYLPFGEPRTIPNSPIAGTDFTYTGQRKLDDGMGGIMDYKARFYSPYINHFLQPDTLVSDPYSPQAWNRYAYVLNNPIRYNDPSGHAVCTDDGYCGKISDTSYQKYIYSNAIRDVYQWNLEGNWSLDELKTIYQTGRDIEEYADSQTGGNGLDWMLDALGNTTIEHWNPGDGHSDAMPTWTGPRIRLDQNWLIHQWGGKEVFAHELGHVWDINTGFAASYHLDMDLGGDTWLFGSPTGSVPRWPSYYHETKDGDAYGNKGRNEYFAEAFAATIYHPNDAPIDVTSLIDTQISNFWYFLPWR